MKIVIIIIAAVIIYGLIIASTNKNKNEANTFSNASNDTGGGADIIHPHNIHDTDSVDSSSDSGGGDGGSE